MGVSEWVEMVCIWGLKCFGFESGLEGLGLESRKFKLGTLQFGNKNYFS